MRKAWWQNPLNIYLKVPSHLRKQILKMYKSMMFMGAFFGGLGSHAAACSDTMKQKKEVGNCNIIIKNFGFSVFCRKRPLSLFNRKKTWCV